jgi:hypothetical protein
VSANHMAASSACERVTVSGSMSLGSIALVPFPLLCITLALCFATFGVSFVIDNTLGVVAQHAGMWIAGHGLRLFPRILCRALADQLRHCSVIQAETVQLASVNVVCK